MTDTPRNNRGILWLLVALPAVAVAGIAWFGKPTTVPGPTNPTTEPATFPLPPYSETRFLNTGPEAHYVGSATCANCHKTNHASYLLTAHSRALSDVDPKTEPPDSSFYHAASGRTYRVYRKDGQLRHEEVMRSADGKEITRVDLPVRYGVGSGHSARAYVVEVDGFLHASPITWYASRKKWDLSPGYDSHQHWGFERPIQVSCLICHAGRVEEAGAVHRLKLHEQAIGCESCHGPGSLHETLHRTRKLAPGEEDFTIVHPGKLARPIQESICAACHQSGLVQVLLRGRREGDFRPGRPLSDHRIHYQFAGNNNQMTIVGHVEQLRQSSCYQKSPMLSCVSCHDPHRREQPVDVIAFYREKCLSCHTTKPCKVELRERLKKEPRDNCAACHMPRGDTDVPHIAFTHHRIGLHGASPAAPSGKIPELVPTDDEQRLAPIDRQRNLGLAYVKLYRDPGQVKFFKVFRERARENLDAAFTAGLRDGEAMAELAEIYRTLDDYPRADALARETLELKDLSLGLRAQALYVLADTEREKENFTSSGGRLEEAVRLRRSSDNWRLLGMNYLVRDQPEKALAALQEALAVRPYQPDTHLGLEAAYRRLGDPQRADEHLQKAEWLRLNKHN